jgi:hypothetical protein
MTPDSQNKKDIFANIPKITPSPKRKTAPEQIQPVVAPQPRYSRTEKLLRALWTLTSVVSMIFSIIVLAALLLLYQTYIKNKDSLKLELPPGIGVNTPEDFLQGLYDNFQLMDEAHIKTDILVEDTIPVQFDLALNQQTDVVLSEDVTIYNAYVVIDTALIDINAPATVILPEGTVLPIYLNLTVPVDTTVPVQLNVPVDIALEETDLHKPFAGLQDVVQPLYCLVAPDATSIKGNAVCP